MSEVTRILSAIDSGDSASAEELLPLVYRELRQLAAKRLAQEAPGNTLQATALVHAAYVRLVDVNTPQRWESRAHFFGAAAEAMRRILIESVRRKRTHKRGGGCLRLDLDQVTVISVEPDEDLLALDEALTDLESHEPQAAKLVKLRYFAGVNQGEAAQMLGISRRIADRLWALARAWLYERLAADSSRPTKT